MNILKKCNKKVIRTFLLNFLIVFLYLILSRIWVDYGGTAFNLLRTEILLFILFFSIFSSNIEKYSRWGFKFLPALLFCILYLSVDAFYSYLYRLPNISDLYELPTVYSQMPFLIGLLFLFSVLIVGSFLVVFISATAFKKVVTLLVILFFVSGLPAKYFLSVRKAYHWSYRKTIRKNGRIVAILNEHSLRSERSKKLSKYSEYNSKMSEVKPNQKKPNIYIFVLESYFDPTYLNLKKSVSEKVKNSVPKINFFETIVPVYGGGTAKTEYELLTGTPSFGTIEYVEFNAFTGQPANNWVFNFLVSGYASYATSGAGRYFFNSTQAYKSLGFENVEFLKEKSKFKGDDIVYDGNLFKYNLSKIDSLLKKKKPFVYYSIGMYGHQPFERDLVLRPTIVEADNKKIQRLLNQYIYRTRDLQKFITKIRTKDPESLLLVVGDHLPPILSSQIKYKKNKYQTQAFAVFNGEELRYSRIKTHKLIRDLLSKVSDFPCCIFDKKTLENEYYKILFNGSRG